MGQPPNKTLRGRGGRHAPTGGTTRGSATRSGATQGGAKKSGASRGGPHNGGHRTGTARRGKPSYQGHDGDEEVGWIWGKHAAGAAIANPKRQLHEILATRNALRDLPDHISPAIREAISAVDPGLIDQALPPGAVHQGLAVRCRRLPSRPLEDIIARPGPIVVLDQVTDPHNVGALIRSAAAFGAAGMVLQDRKAPPFMGACAKAAVGAAEQVPHARVVNIARALEEMAEAGIYVIGLAGAADMALGAAVLCAGGRRLAVVLGSEDKGLRPSVAQACATTAHIPIESQVESLNVSTAAAVALYALTQRGDDPAEATGSQ